MERLDKIISAQSTFSRKEARNLIRDGSVSVNGKVVESPDAMFNPDKDKLSLFDRPVRVRRFLYIMLNKPAGILSAAKMPAQKPWWICFPPPSTGAAYSRQAGWIKTLPVLFLSLTTATLLTAYFP